MRNALFVTFAFALLAACGGNVVVDPPANGGAGGMWSTSTSSSSGWSSSSSSSGWASSSSSSGWSSSSSGSSGTTTWTTSTTWAGPCGGVVSGDFTCEQCVETYCCADLQQCPPGSACALLIGCQKLCGPQDGACQAKCAEIYSEGWGPLMNLTQCANNNCGDDACVASVCDGSVAAPGPFCDACVNQNLCGELEACFSDVVCLDCISGMQENCDNNGPYVQLFDALQQWCGNVCF